MKDLAKGEREIERGVPLDPDSDLELIGDFINESQDYLERAERALLLLETSPENHEAVNTVLRAFHTIKGSSSFMNLPWIAELAHHAESLLIGMRDGETCSSAGNADLALQSVDMMKELLGLTQKAIGGVPMIKPAGYDPLMKLLVSPKEPEDQNPTEEAADAPVETAPRVESTIRVSTERLDQLIDMVGELVIAHSLVSQDKAILSGTDHELARKVTHAGKIVRELQDLSTSMRMVPLKGTFSKMNRLVRDLSHKSGKSIHLETDDRDTEIDRNMVDVINDLLVHMVRNAADHGIEPSEVRVRNGKSSTGTIWLSASQSGGNVVVDIRDDGKGLDRDKIIEKAVARGVIASGKAMSDEEVFNLIFEPGFSTADKITDVSGRGVGMDVVKRGVESLRGRLEISSSAGAGTSFSVRLPMTLAITDGMLVRVGSERYIIPTINIHFSFRPDADALSTIAGKGELVTLRGDLMPLFRLHRIFSIEGAVEDPTRALLVVVSDKDKRCALLVDELLGQHQLVAKSLSSMGTIPGVSGGAILGDGRVGLIIDPTQILALARSMSAAATAA